MPRIFWDGPTASVFISKAERMPRNELKVEREGDYFNLYSPLFEHYEMKGVHYLDVLDRDGNQVGTQEETQAYLEDVVKGTTVVDSQEQGSDSNVIIYQTTIAPEINITNIFGPRGVVFRDLTDYLEAQITMVLDGVLQTAFEVTDKLVMQIFDTTWKTVVESPFPEWVITDIGGPLVAQTPFKGIPQGLRKKGPTRVITERSSVSSQIQATNLKISTILRN